MVRPARYVIISPVRNEAKHLPGTIASLAGQTMPPAQWIVVDDGSTDESKTILAKAALEHPWITVVKRSDRGARKPGTGVIEAFYDGMPELKVTDWEFLIKLDGDVSFERDYMERCFAQFQADPKLGIGGGTVCAQRPEGLVPESSIDPAFHVRGATKIYKRECWDVIGGLLRAPGWDTLDELKANMLGWKTRTFKDIKLTHHKPAGSADGSWTNWFKNGRANYLVGYHPLFMVLKSARRMFYKPYGLQAFGLLAGFFSGYFSGVRQIPDRELIAYLRRQQMRKLAFQPSLWSE
jgi:biofilm PGA synthesis N-glycosyltransferase PgaC